MPLQDIRLLNPAVSRITFFCMRKTIKELYKKPYVEVTITNVCSNNRMELRLFNLVDLS
jgi:hypothetical protein